MAALPMAAAAAKKWFGKINEAQQGNGLVKRNFTRMVMIISCEFV